MEIVILSYQKSFSFLFSYILVTIFPVNQLKILVIFLLHMEPITKLRNFIVFFMKSFTYGPSFLSPLPLT